MFALAEGWDDVLPPALAEIMKYDGKYVAARQSTSTASTGSGRIRNCWHRLTPRSRPVGRNSTQPPRKLMEAGITPLAHGGQPWQDATVFEVVALGLAVPTSSARHFVELDMDALNSDTMIEVFDQMRKMRGYVDPGFSGRDWNLATSMVMNGEAAFQIMGDWAKGEFLAGGKVPGEDFLCAPAPATPSS